MPPGILGASLRRARSVPDSSRSPQPGRRGPGLFSPGRRAGATAPRSPQEAVPARGFLLAGLCRSCSLAAADQRTAAPRRGHPRPALAVPAPGAAGRPGPGWLALGGLLLRVREAPGDTEAGRSGLQARPRRGAQASARLGTRESPPGRSVEDAEAKLEARTRRRERAFPGLRLRNDRPGREQGRRRWERAQRRLRGTHPAVPGARPLTWSAPEPPPEWAVGLMSRRDFKESGGAFPSAHTALAGHTGSDSNVAPPGKPNWTRGSASFQPFDPGVRGSENCFPESKEVGGGQRRGCRRERSPTAPPQPIHPSTHLPRDICSKG